MKSLFFLGKKPILICLLMAVLGLVSVSAETWAQFIDRTHLMENNFQTGISRGHWSTWSNDKWAALMATTYWLEGAYEDIFKNAPHLTQYERDIYRGIWQRRRTQSDDMKRLLDLAGLSNSDRREIVRRWEYWEEHLEKGGTIRIN